MKCFLKVLYMNPNSEGANIVDTTMLFSAWQTEAIPSSIKIIPDSSRVGGKR